MVKVHDIRSKTPRSNGTRRESQIRNIARHHSGPPGIGSWESFWRFWRDDRGWGTGGYHEIILRDGSVQLCYDPHEITNGVGGHNTHTYHICVVGNGSFTAAQEVAFRERCKLAMARFSLPVSAVWGHNEFPGTSTACPGINMNDVRRGLSGASNTSSKPSPKPASASSKASVSTVAQEVINGKWGNGDVRASNLKKAGYNASAVQKKVNELLGAPAPVVNKSSVSIVAQEVIDGKWGNGADRTAKLKKAGYNPATVQSKVNQLLKSPAPKDSVAAVAREVVAGKWGNGVNRQRNLENAGYNYAEVQQRVNSLL